MVAAFGGTAARFPDAPKHPCNEFCAMVMGLRVVTLAPIFKNSLSVPANSGTSGSINARCPVQPGPL